MASGIWAVMAPDLCSMSKTYTGALFPSPSSEDERRSKLWFAAPENARRLLAAVIFPKHQHDMIRWQIRSFFLTFEISRCLNDRRRS
jgi:hypothetical protein